MISVLPPPTFLVLLLLTITNLLVPLSNSAPNPTMPPKRNSSSADPFRFPQQQQNKKLRRLPHVFSKVLELPLSSDADVSVEERSDSFRFVAEFDCLGDGAGDVRVLVIESLPGIKKVLVGDGDESEVDVWRVRLPDTTCLEAATAVCRSGQLVVTVPKIGGGGGGGTEKTPPGCHGDIKNSVGNSLAVY